MSLFFWQYDIDPDFPLGMLEHTSHGHQDRMHWHNYLQIALCTAGSGRYLFANKEYTIRPGDVFVIDNFESHVAVADEGSGVTFLFAIFLPDLIAPPGSSSFDFEYLSPFWHDPDGFCHQLDAGSPLAEAVGSILREMYQIWQEKPLGYRHLLDANLRRALALLIQHYRLPEPQDCFININSYVQMQPAIYYIKTHFSENVTLEDVSRSVHMSASRFRHLFKQMTHIGFKEYVSVLRLAEAKKLLMTTDQPVTDIASQVGFSNINQFYKIFQKNVQLSPGEYRRTARLGNADLLRKAG